MRYTGVIKETLGKNGMVHYNFDLGNVDGLSCVGKERQIIEKGNFSLCLSYDKEGYKCWNENGVQLQIQVWDFKEKGNIKIEDRNGSIYNKVEMDLNLNSVEDFDRLIFGLQELKEIFIERKNGE